MQRNASRQSGERGSVHEFLEQVDEQYSSGTRTAELGINVTYMRVQKLLGKRRLAAFRIHIFLAKNQCLSHGRKKPTRLNTQ